MTFFSNMDYDMNIVFPPQRHIYRELSCNINTDTTPIGVLKKSTMSQGNREDLKKPQNIIKETLLKKEDIICKKRVTKEKIPATLKNILWHKYFDTSITGLCQCCKVEIISKAIFDAGHIISEKNGGKVILDNLKPICKLCNSSMGKTNMDEFMKKYGI